MTRLFGDDALANGSWRRRPEKKARCAPEAGCRGRRSGRSAGQRLSYRSQSRHACSTQTWETDIRTHCRKQAIGNIRQQDGWMSDIDRQSGASTHEKPERAWWGKLTRRLHKHKHLETLHARSITFNNGGDDEHQSAIFFLSDSTRYSSVICSLVYFLPCAIRILGLGLG
ncbi:uncharacterized protein LY79DRAFT_560815 [Colletotrichum navitas]|uniref:Uncharacterized protein n=1 Tax=Colletotrichum navitas TaxID=681940 RepID=A0AAD8PUD9_9PEZI|nr:uncharacterized protein LY79DRAFT_560815 [Colletotrichum navitas]KAK1580751.1 hypothetical protein LY79DRAFT_560815 [Colletotrichum navitas]